MRKLLTKDVFAFMRILQKLELEKIKNGLDLSKSQEEVGKDLMLLLLGHSANAEMEIYEFFAGVLEKTVEEVQNMPLSEWPAILKELMTQNDVTNFIKQAQSIA